MTTTTNSSQESKLFQEDSSSAQRQKTVAEIVEEYEQLGEMEREGETAVSLRQKFLQAIQEEPDLLQKSQFSNFLAKHIQPEEIADLEWESPSSMLLFSESLYHSRFENAEFAQQLNQHASLLLRRALHQYEKEGEMEKMFELLRLAPSYLLHEDEELSRLHYRANAYEIRRVRRNRRFLYGFLLVQIILILFVFPYLFINAENGQLQRQVEELADVKLGDEGYRPIPYSEAVYWSVITAGSIGYGDITPSTTTGRIIAGILGIMGVVTVGVLAGLVLDWITPRRIT
jgi:hypothetical protein